MPVSTYVGVPRSGKSYLMVLQVILPAVESGRRVVSNIAGLSEVEIHRYLIEERKQPKEKLGHVLHVSNEQCSAKNFLPRVDVEGDSIVLPGDLLLIDEAQMFWGYGDKLSQAHLEFLTQHGHFVHPVTKRCCDIVLATQDLRLINRKALGVVDKVFHVQRKEELGMDNTYVLTVYNGSSLTKANRVMSHLPERFDKRIFPLYHSFAGGDGVVSTVDKSANLFKSKKFRYAAVIVLMLGVWSVSTLMSVFSAKPEKSAAPKNSKLIPIKDDLANPQHVTKKPSTESAWQAVGYYRTGENLFVVLKRGNAYRTLMNPRQFYLDTLRYYGSLDGLTVANYTGQQDSKPSTGVFK